MNWQELQFYLVKYLDFPHSTLPFGSNLTLHYQYCLQSIVKTYLIIMMKTNLAHFHGPGFLEVAPFGVHNIQVILFVSLNRVGFHQLTAISEQCFWNVV